MHVVALCYPRRCFFIATIYDIAHAWKGKNMGSKSLVGGMEDAPAPPASWRRPRLLFLCQTLPFPPDGGVHIRSYNILKQLSREFDIVALCFFRRATRPNQADVRRGIEGLSRLSEVEAFPIPQEYNRSRLVWDHFRSVLFRRPYTFYTYKSKAFSRRLQHLLKQGDFDLVHVDSLDLSAHLPDLAATPIVCTHHNVESELLRRRAFSESSRLFRWYLDFQANLTDSEHRRWCRRVALNIVVSEEDGQLLSRLVPNARISVVPNGVDTTMFRPRYSCGHGLVFVGGYSWYPNRDGMAYFADRILPLIRRTYPDLPVTWVGRAPEEVQKEYLTTYGIRLTGYVEDIRPHVHSAACYVVPLRVGGGTRLKILDAWAMGKAVVSTSVGCEGLDARDGENILIRDNPEAFAEAVDSVLRDNELRRRLERNARTTAERVYDWDVIGRDMLQLYQTLLTRDDCASHRHQRRGD